MTSPTLPSFTTRKPKHPTTNRLKLLRRQQRRADIFLCIYSCVLIATLVLMALH
jgi:hypothetical protein